MADPTESRSETGSESSPESGSYIADPIGQIARQHAVQEGLCALLEKIADGLPHDIDRADVSAAIACLGDELPLLQRDEDDGLFPLLKIRCPPGDDIEPALEKLELEHATDHSFAGDIAEMLRELNRGGSVVNPEMLGYMLRSFFESYRRHLFWERRAVLPLARERLTAEDIKELGRRMHAHRKDRARQARRMQSAGSLEPNGEAG